MTSRFLAWPVRLATSVLFAAFAHDALALPWTESPKALVILRETDAGDLRAFLDALTAAGGHASVVYAPAALTVYADPAVLADPAVRTWIAESHIGEIDAARFEAYGPETARAARAWNQSLQLRGTTVEVPHGFTPWPDAGPLPAQAARLPAPPQPAVSDNQPLGAEYYDTSEFLAGSSAVGVWLLEAAGATYDWTQAEEDLTLGGVQASLDNWVQKGGTGAFLTFFLDVHTGVPVSGVPIENPMTMDEAWVDEALAGEGWPGFDGFSRCWAYNNSATRSTRTGPSQS